MMTTLSKIKTERIFSMLWTPLAIYQILNANKDSITLAIIIEALFLFGIYFTTKEMRKEFKEVAPQIDDKILQIIALKKETFSKIKSIYHKRKSSKSLSYSIINQNS